MKRDFLYSSSVLIGTIVGVGLFAIPFSFAKAGFTLGLLFLFLTTLLVLFSHLAYGEITLRTEGDHQSQLVGYTKKYLNKLSQSIIFFSVILSGYGAILAYTIISGEFLANIFGSIIYFSPTTFSILFFIVGTLIVVSGLKTVAKFELAMSVFFFLIIFILLGFSIPKIDLSNFSFMNQGFWFLPYGTLLFALSGTVAIPLMRNLLSKEPRLLKKSIIWGTIIPSILFLIFTIVVIGVSGESTSPEAVSGLLEFLGSKIIVIASIFGFVAIFTSFISMVTVLFETFKHDLGFKKIPAWLLTLVIPFVLFLIGIRTFINIVSLTGAIALGIESIIIILIYRKARKFGERIPEYSISIPNWLLFLMILLFGAGIVYSIVS